jgi:hypothetical protein
MVGAQFAKSSRKQNFEIDRAAKIILRIGTLSRQKKGLNQKKQQE